MLQGGGGGAYLISSPKRGGLHREGGAYLKSYISVEIPNNFPNLTITPLTTCKTEQEIGLVSPFYKCNVIYILMPHYFWI